MLYTNYYSPPKRKRSYVRTKQRISPKREAEFMCRSGLDCDALKVELINRRIGYGVFATQNFPKGSFLVEYVGERIVPKEAEEREKKRKIKHTSYMFYSKWNGLKCIDATNTERKGKYIKDEEVGSPLNNCVMRLLVTENYPRLCLFANRDIKAGEELRYDYGEANLPWRQDSEENNEETIDTETESEKEVDDDSNTASPMEVSVQRHTWTALERHPWSDSLITLSN
ncbi:N-lysine methyltransferase KMT5A-like isoform X3 [Crassostrea angulata]|uniref:N-lysine methyltransferase KMT5A-like isoform X3 n=1 Tax=Magallana angulata TaxID=2784310 RepID=UPI0022B129F2|nr:N-lysine methyltransferase KMT5A-like isoform X3 [Crassostrea angulata]